MSVAVTALKDTRERNIGGADQEADDGDDDEDSERGDAAGVAHHLPLDQVVLQEPQSVGGRLPSAQSASMETVSATPTETTPESNGPTTDDLDECGDDAEQGPVGQPRSPRTGPWNVAIGRNGARYLTAPK